MTPNLSTFYYFSFYRTYIQRNFSSYFLNQYFISLFWKDDDVRVPFGKAHDHAREIVEEHQALDKLGEAIKGQL